MVFRPTECQHLKIRVVIGQTALLVCCQMASDSRRKIFRGVFSLFRPTTTAFLRRLVFLLHDRSLICKFSVEKVVAGSLNTNQPFWCCRTRFFTLIPAGRRYACFVPLCFRVFHLDNHGSWGHQRRFWRLFYYLGGFERIKTVLVGTNTPHKCIPGLVWQNKHVDFHNLSLKTANSDFPFTSYVLPQFVEIL